MRLPDELKNRFHSVIQWNDPKELEIFRRFTNKSRELKNASRLIIYPGQGCIFAYDGKTEAMLDRPGVYDLENTTLPFFAVLNSVLNTLQDDHKAALWFYRKTDTFNIQWSTHLPITYADPVYGLQVHLRSHGTYSMRITQPVAFFSNIIARQENYFVHDLQELFLSRISRSIGHHLTNAGFSCAETGTHVKSLAGDVREKANILFEDIGFKVSDFRIEGISYDEETNRLIAGISQARDAVKAAPWNNDNETTPEINANSSGR